MPVYRCDWCGRFYSDSGPEGTACPNHIPEHNARLRESIARHNEKIEKRNHWCQGGPEFHAECWTCVSLIG